MSNLIESVQYRTENVFWSARSLPLGPDGGSWMIWSQANNSKLGALAGQIMLAKLPPFPGGDTVGRNDFIQIAVNAPKPTVSGAVSARVQFGYAENGPANNFYCTSRQEACIKGDQSGTNFNFASESVTPIACTNGCTINIPTIPAHTVYLNVQYLNNAGSVVETSETQVVSIEPPLRVVNFSDHLAPSAPSGLRTTAPS